MAKRTVIDFTNAKGKKGSVGKKAAKKGKGKGKPF